MVRTLSRCPLTPVRRVGGFRRKKRRGVRRDPLSQGPVEAAFATRIENQPKVYIQMRLVWASLDTSKGHGTLKDGPEDAPR